MVGKGTLLTGLPPRTHLESSEATISGEFLICVPDLSPFNMIQIYSVILNALASLRLATTKPYILEHFQSAQVRSNLQGIRANDEAHG